MFYVTVALLLFLFISVAIPVIYTANKKAEQNRFGLNAWEDTPQ